MKSAAVNKRNRPIEDISTVKGERRAKRKEKERPSQSGSPREELGIEDSEAARNRAAKSSKLGRRARLEDDDEEDF